MKSLQHCLRRQARALANTPHPPPPQQLLPRACPFSPCRPVHSHAPPAPRRPLAGSARLLSTADNASKDAAATTPTTPPASTASLPTPSPTDDASPPKSATAKRKPRPKATKDSLRRVAMVAQDPARPSSSKTVPAASAATTATSPSSLPAWATPASPASDPSADPDTPPPTVSAVCVAEGFEMATVLDILRSHSFEIDPDGTGFEASEVVHARGFNSDDIFVFPSGTVVTWGVDPDPMVRTLLSAAVEPYPEPLRETEDLEYIADPAKLASTLRNDTIILGTQREAVAGDRLDTTLAKIAFSSGVARSAKLGVLETALTAYLETTRLIPDMLSKGASRFHLDPDFIWQKAGELLSLRARLNHYSELTDSLPDIFWDRKTELNLENYYDDVGRALDVRIRILTLNQKMDYAGEIGTILRQMVSEQHGARSVVTSHRLEIIIILLIAVELLLALRRETMEGNLPWSEGHEGRAEKTKESSSR